MESHSMDKYECVVCMYLVHGMCGMYGMERYVWDVWYVKSMDV